MAAKKPTTQAAAKQPEAKQPAPKPEESKAEDTLEQSKERGPAKDGNLPGDDDQASPEEGEITLEVVTRLPRRIRGGVIVTQEPREVVVTEEVAALIEADPHISATRK